jgi:acetyltransferase-like isoleucine patch superfamily enzyme
LSKITSDHRIDCTATVHIGSFSTIAGTGSELWTHGYVHALQGAGRYRVDGRIRIGNNVYVGSSCIITTGVSLANGVIVGAGATVARSLTEPGMYVSAALRRLDRPGDPDIRADLLADDSPELCERVYIKRP